MKLNNKNWQKILLVSALTVGSVASLNAYADYGMRHGGDFMRGDRHCADMMCDGYGGDMKRGDGRGDLRGKRMEVLKSTLKLSAAQESNWSKLQADLKKSDDIRDNVSRAQWRDMTMPQRMEKMNQVREAREKAMLSFYNTLTAEQKKIMDEHGFGR